MKVLEILTEVVKKSKLGNIPVIHLPSNSRFRDHNIKNNIGGGGQALAFDHSTQLNTIIKTIYVKLQIDSSGNVTSNDGQIINTNMILDHQDNPFFPKIYKAILYKTDNPHGKHVLYLEMEKLHELTNNKIKHNIDNILKSLGLDDALLQNIDDNDDSKIQALVDIFKSITHKNNKMKDFIGSSNPAFKEAITILRNTATQKKTSYDLHSENYMYRMTSVGIQLVIIDHFV